MIGLPELEAAIDNLPQIHNHYIALDHAALCMNCGVIFDNRVGDCPCCASSAVGLISSFLTPSEAL